MDKFKRLTVATTVSAALVGTTSVNALTLAEPGGALLVPYALCDTANGINTMVGIVQAGRIGTKGLTSYSLSPANVIVPLGLTNFDGQFVLPAQGSTWTGNVHWFFMNSRSEEEASGFIPVTHDDFVGFDWCSQLVLHEGGAGSPLDGQAGYLVFVGDSGGIGGAPGSILNLFGDAAVIQGNWGAAAWDPVIPMRELDDAGGISNCGVPLVGGPDVFDELCWSGSGPNVNPVNGGQPLGDDDGVQRAAHMDVRYFLGDLGLGADAETDLVFWFDQNYSNTANAFPVYTSLSVNVFDEDEVPHNTAIQLPDELNVLDARSVGWTLTNQSGFIEVILPESDVFPDDGMVGSTVAFSLIWFGPGSSDGAQTVLAHNRGIW